MIITPIPVDNHTMWIHSILFFIVLSVGLHWPNELAHHHLVGTRQVFVQSIRSHYI